MSLIIEVNVACAGQVGRRDYSSYNDESGWHVRYPHSTALSPMLPSRKWLSGITVQVTINSHTFNISSHLVLWPAFSYIGKESLFMSLESNSYNLMILNLSTNHLSLNKKISSGPRRMQIQMLFSLNFQKST